MSSNEGPFVKVACFCELVLEDKSNVFSLIRVVDVVTQTAKGNNPPDDMPPFSRPLKMVLMLVPGKAKGRWDINVKIEEPSGIKIEGPSISAHFEGENKAANFIMNINHTFSQEGIYWFWISMGDKILAGVPFQVKYNRIVTS